MKLRSATTRPRTLTLNDSDANTSHLTTLAGVFREFQYPTPPLHVLAELEMQTRMALVPDGWDLPADVADETVGAA